MYNTNQVNIYTNKHAKKKFIRLSRHIYCAKRQLETYLRMHATVRRTLSQLKETFATVCKLSRTFCFIERSPA